MKTNLLILVLSVAAAVGSRAQLVETNVALGKPTTGDTAFGFPTSNGNDGSISTFNHADNVNPAPDNPYWTVDLQGAFHLMRVDELP